MKCRFVIPLTLAALTTSLGLWPGSSTAHAAGKPYIERPYSGKRAKHLDLHVGGSGYWGGGLAVGARFSIPILHNGFIKSANNSVQIVPGIDFIYSRWYGDYDYGRLGFHIPILLNWTFYFSPEFSAFVELGPAFTFFPRYRDYEPRYRHAYGFFSAGLGGRYMIQKNLGLVFRLGTPTIALGLSIQI